jgi:hypothetical protein
MERFSEAPRKRREAIKPPEPWTWRDKASVLACLAAVSLFFLVPYLDQSMKYQRSIDVRLESWRADYDLTAETVEKLRVIELAFHDFESPFSRAPRPSALESEAHGLEIAKHLSPEHAKVFLERETANHEKHSGKGR